MRKKILAGLLSLTVVASLAGFSQIASAEGEATSIVVYENDFNASTVQEALPAFENDYVSYWGYDGAEGTKPQFANGALYGRPESGPNGRTLLFDFTKGNTQPGISGGVFKISYDLALRGGSLTTAYAQTYTGINMSDNPKDGYWNGGRMVYFDATGWDAKPTINAYPSTPTHMVDTNPHKYEFMFDFAGKKAYVYVDGKLEHTFTNLHDTYGVIKNYSIAFNGDIKSLDNMKMEWWKDYPEFSVEISEPTSDGIDVNTNFPVKNWVTFEDGIKVVRVFDGKEMEAAVVSESVTEAKITVADGFENGYKYEISIPDEISSFIGEAYAFEKTQIEANFAESNSVSGVRFKNYAGDVLTVEEENPAELQSIIVEFTEDVDAASKMGSITLVDSDSNDVPFKVKSKLNAGEIIFDGVLKENSEYTLDIGGFDVEYKITFKTKEGFVCVKSVKVYKDGKEITEAEDLNSGDSVLAVLEIANTTDTEQGYLASCTMQNGKLMTGADFEYATVSPYTKDTWEFEMNIEDTCDLSFAGLLWHNEMTAPLAMPVTLNIN